MSDAKKPKPRKPMKLRDDFMAELEPLGFVYEYKFHPTRGWLFDAAHPELCIALEYNGIMGGKTGHSSIPGLLRDAEKFTEAAILGWIVIIATAPTVRSGQAREWVERAIAARGGASESTTIQ